MKDIITNNFMMGWTCRLDGAKEEMHEKLSGVSSSPDNVRTITPRRL
jgi:hypothetical protein